MWAEDKRYSAMNDIRIQVITFNQFRENDI